MFHAATALLLHKEIERSSPHAIVSAFGEYIARLGLVDPKLHKHFLEAFTLRNDCDYLAPFEPEKSQAQLTLQQATEFVAACRKLCG